MSKAAAVMTTAELIGAMQARLTAEANRMNSAYDRYGMDNTPETVDPLAYHLARRCEALMTQEGGK